ncbi:hypothetical protein C8R44DRAFT_876571 [Mycena epipterygia]|nr:hypothetical protein C8R44DRAFT_876571 [Mycena epipterygia]
MFGSTGGYVLPPRFQLTSSIKATASLVSAPVLQRFFAEPAHYNNKSLHLLLPPLTHGHPPAVHASIGTGWSVTNISSAGLNDITFSLTIVQADHISDYYCAQQFGFVGLVDIGYTGLQPRLESGGNPMIHGVFLSFVARTTTNAKNCSHM